VATFLFSPQFVAAKVDSYRRFVDSSSVTQAAVGDIVRRFYAVNAMLPKDIYRCRLSRQASAHTVHWIAASWYDRSVASRSTRANHMQTLVKTEADLKDQERDRVKPWCCGLRLVAWSCSLRLAAFSSLRYSPKPDHHRKGRLCFLGA